MPATTRKRKISANALEAMTRNVASDKVTEQILLGMLTENTGRSFGDSGDYYGRNWQQNKKLTLEALHEQPEATMDFSDGLSSLRLNVFHFLRHRLSYAPALDKLFKGRYLADCEEGGRERCLYDIQDGFAGWLREQGCTEVSAHNMATVNTYNGEDSLSQILQYRTFFFGDVAIFLLQIHGGCDARGGYTDPKVFIGEDMYSLADNAEGTLYCKTPADASLYTGQLSLFPVEEPAAHAGHWWDTDNGGYTWEGESTKLKSFPELKRDDYLANQRIVQTERERIEAECRDRGDVWIDYSDLRDEDDMPIDDYGPRWPVPGYLCIDGKIGYCPICGGELQASLPPTG